MTDAQTNSWILLSISYGGGTREEIARIADGINHAVPTEKEIDSSLCWLQEHRLVCEKGGRFSLTKTGKALFSKIRGSNLFKKWDAVSKAIENI